MTLWEKIEELCLEELGGRASYPGGHFDNVELIGLAATVGQIIAITTVSSLAVCTSSLKRVPHSLARENE